MNQPEPLFIPPTPGGELPGNRAPDAVTWFRVFCGLQIFFFGLTTAVGLVMFIATLISPPPPSPGDPPPWIIGLVITVLYGPALVAYVVGVIAPRKRWMQTYGLVLTVLSFVCGGCWPLGVVALVMWTKPETKSWFESAT